MPSTIGKCKLFRIKHITILEGETFLRNKYEIAIFEIKCTFFGRKENTISLNYGVGIKLFSVRQLMHKMTNFKCRHNNLFKKKKKLTEIANYVISPVVSTRIKSILVN